jgi:uncharacterized membrane protein YccC
MAGATVSKCLNRIGGTLLAGLFAWGIQRVASQSGNETIEHIINGVAVFLLGLQIPLIK